MFEIFLLTIFYLFVAVKPAHAYLDPGTGSYITQVVVAFMIGGGYMLKVYWHKITTFLSSFFKKTHKDDAEKNN